MVQLPLTRQTCLLEQTVGGCDSHPLLSTCCFQNKTVSLLVLPWGWVAELCDQRSESLTLSGTESTYKKPQWICVKVVIYTFVSIYLFVLQMQFQNWSLIKATTANWCRSRWARAAWPQRRSSETSTAPFQTTPPSKTPPASLRSDASSPPTLTAIPKSVTVR